MNEARRIVISGYYGFGNAGDEAMLAAMIEALTTVDPAISIVVLSGDPVETRRRHGVDAVFRLNYPQIVRSLAGSRLLISGGGSLLQDVTSNRSLYYYLSIMLLAKKLGKPVMLYAQGIGPVRGALAKSAMRYIGNMADLITVRDEGSCEELQRLRVTKPPVYVTADPVLGMCPQDKQTGRLIFRQHGLEGAAPVVGLSVREWKDWQVYKDVLAQTADLIAEEYGARLVYIPMQCPEDAETAKKIAALSSKPAVVLEGEYSTGELLSLVGNLDMLISIRLHALIFAAVMRVPMIGLSYDPKIDRFLETMGASPAGSLHSLTTDELMYSVRALWADMSAPDTVREDRLRPLHDKAFHSAELAVELMNSRVKQR